jgi:hypothetical protein
MKPKYKNKMRQKQRERAGANRGESAEWMRKLRERCKVETSGVASETGVASTSRSAQEMDRHK